MSKEDGVFIYKVLLLIVSGLLPGLLTTYPASQHSQCDPYMSRPPSCAEINHSGTVTEDGRKMRLIYTRVSADGYDRAPPASAKTAF